MAAIPIPLGLQSYSRPSGFQPEVELLNMYIEKDESGSPETDTIFRLQRPALAPYLTLTGDIRGIYQKTGVGDGLPFIAAGASLVATDGAAIKTIGAITDDGLSVPFAASNFAIGMAAGGDFFLYNYTTLKKIALPDGQKIIDCECISSYFILPMTDGTFFWLAPGATTIDALDYATAESCPDGLVGVKRLNDELYFFGTSTVEVWQLSGDPTTVFQKASGRVYDKGALARDTIQNFDNSIVFVGDDAIVYRVDTVPTRISDFGIEERLRKRTGLPSAWVFTVDAHKFYVLRIPGEGTFAYDAATKAWSEFGSYGETVWKPSCGVPLEGGTLCGGAGGKLWTLDPDRSNDDGIPMERTVSGSVSFQGCPIRKDSFSMLLGCEADCTIRLRWKDGREAFGSYRSLPARSPVDIVNLFRLGQSSQPITTFEISCIDDVKVRYSAANLNAGWR